MPLMILFFSTTAQCLVYEGSLFDSTATPIVESGVKINLKITTESSACTLYEVEETLDLSSSDGHFSIDLASSPNISGTTNTLANVLSNQTQTLQCKEGGTYDFTGSFEKRNIQARIKEIDSIAISHVVLPAQQINMVPFAGEAETVKIRGVEIDPTAPTSNQVLKYDGTKYVPANIVATSIDWSSILNIPTDLADGDDDTSYPQVNGSIDGLMISADKTKLDSIATNATADQTAGEILTAIKTVDGASSGLNADLLDGLNSSSFIQTESDPSVLASVKDGVSWSEVTGKPTIPDGFSLDAADGTPINALTLDSSGNVGIGTSSPAGALEISSTSGALVPPRMTQAERDGLTSPPDGSLVYNMTANKMNFRENGSWAEFSSGGGTPSPPNCSAYSPPSNCTNGSAKILQWNGSNWICRTIPLAYTSCNI